MEDPFDEWWEQEGQEIYDHLPVSPDGPVELARKAFEAGMSHAFHISE